MSKLSPNELKQATVKAYVDAARSSGIEPDVRAIEQLAEADLNIAKKRMAEVAAIPKKEKAPISQEEFDHVMRERKKSVAEMMKSAPVPKNAGQAKQARRNVFSLPDSSHSPKMQAAFDRLKVLIKPRGDTYKRAQAGGSIEDIANELSDPVLAKRFLDAWIFYNFDPDNASFSNPFKGKSEHDRNRTLKRIIEDVCDASTGRHGPWWTK